MTRSILDEEADQLYGEALQVPEGGSIVEIGSYKGSSAYALALGAEGRNVKVYCIDTWMGSPGGLEEWGPKRGITEAGSFLPQFKENLKPFIEKGIIVPLEMSSAGALMVEPPLKPHLLFIDGSHVYEDVLFDMTYWWSRLQPGGMMGVHDSTGDSSFHPQVQRALKVFAASHDLKGCILKGSTSWLKKP